MGVARTLRTINEDLLQIFYGAEGSIKSTENICVGQKKQYFINNLYINVTLPLCFTDVRHPALRGTNLIIAALMNCLPEAFTSV